MNVLKKILIKYFGSDVNEEDSRNNDISIKFKAKLMYRLSKELALMLMDVKPMDKQLVDFVLRKRYYEVEAIADKVMEDFSNENFPIEYNGDIETYFFEDFIRKIKWVELSKQ